MALNSGKILMRRGQEVNFDPNKMTPGEWAVSLDSKYVRMCFQPGVCVRMATYDAFEADMVQIQKILAECQTVEEAVQRIYEEIKDVAVDVERIETAAANALKSEQNALNSANSASQSANTAVDKASEASESANTASAKAEQATEGANTATQKASEAAESAGNVRNMSDVSQSYAVGGTGTREGEDTDNAKYYNQQASDNADRAEAAAERASAVADVGVATTEKAGLVRPDGETIRIDPDGTIHADRGTTSYTDLENKPKINDVVLEGEKTLDELGIASKEALEETDNKVNIIIEQAELRFKETASGENIHLDDSADSKLVEFGLYGKARQNTTIGKNLLDYSNGSTVKNGVEYTYNPDGSVTANGTASANSSYYKSITLEAGEYILSGSPSGGASNTYYISTNIGVGNDYGNGVKFTINDKTTFNLYCNVRSGYNAQNLKFYPMIRLASITDNTYEPYTGGIPSPNPDYPQDIEVAGNSGSVEVKSVGKNLLKNTATTQTKYGLTFTSNEYGVVVNGTSGATPIVFSVNTELIKALEAGKEYVISGVPNNPNCYIQVKTKTDATVLELKANEIKSFVQDGTVSEVRIVTRNSGVTFSNVAFKPMIRLASDTDDTYEPYKEIISTIPTNGLAGIPVDSGGNYTDSNGQQWICDEIVKYADGSGEYVQKTKIFILNSNNSGLLKRDGLNNGGKYVYYLNVSGVLDHSSVSSAICSHLKYRIMYHSDIESFYTGTNTIMMATSFETIDEFKNFVNSNPITFILAIKPITTPLTKEQLAEIEKLSTFYPVTNISNDANCGMKVKYIADAKSYIDNRLALIEQAMLNSI